MAEHNEKLAHVRSGDLVLELMARGVLRSYGCSHYVPGVVRQRYMSVPVGEQTDPMSESEFDSIVRAQLTHTLMTSAVANNLIAFTKTREADIHEDAPPNDMRYLAEIMTLDPAADMDELGVPAEYGGAYYDYDPGEE